GVGLLCYAVWTRGAASGLRAYWAHWQNNDVVFPLVERWTGSFLAARWVTTIGLGALIALLLARAASTETASRAAMRAGLGMGPVAHPWYFGWPLALEPLGPSWPWLLLSLLSLFSYGILRPPAEGTNAHLAMGWRCLEYAVPLVLALLLWSMRRRRAPG